VLLKWIVCDVGEETRASFFAAQEHWGKLASAPGFLGQVGGWDTRTGDGACIISIWRDLPSYESFMGCLHDEIVAESGQIGDYLLDTGHLFDMSERVIVRQGPTLVL